jgi:cardiolipin synthase
VRPFAAVVVLAAVLAAPVTPAATASSPTTVPGPPAAEAASSSPAAQRAPSFPAPATTDPPNGTTPEAAIVAVYPNPVPDGDRGEYVVVQTPPSAGWRLTDGETTVRLPGGADRVVVTATPAAVNASARVVVAPDLRLANAGDHLRLVHGDAVVDAVRYERAPESEVLRPDDGGWRPRGATDLAPATAGPAPVEAFVLPDAPAVPVETIGDASERVLLAGYTLSSWRVARALVAATERGATVRVLLEGGPVGGITRRAARVLDWLVDRGVPVAVVDGPRARYVYHHPWSRELNTAVCRTINIPILIN